MLSDYQLALLLQEQYDGKIPVTTVSEVAYSRIDDTNGITILFRGTSDLEDAKRDLDTGMVESGFGLVHAGAHSGLRDIFIAEQPTLPIDAYILLIGHSLGAMEAADFACILYMAGYRNIEVVTFESPRWGDQQAMQYFSQIKNRSYRNYKDMWVHDFFTTIPVWLPTLPFHPVPNCHQFWSAPTSLNEWREAPENIQAHSLKDCVIPYLATLCGS